VNVAELHALLGEHVAHGRGGDTVYVYFADFDEVGGEDSEFYELFQRRNWVVTHTGWTDDRDAFYTLTFAAEPEDQTTA